MTFTIHLIFILRIKYKKHNSFTTQSKQKICKTNVVFTKPKVTKKSCLLFQELHESKINSTKHMSTNAQSISRTPLEQSRPKYEIHLEVDPTMEHRAQSLPGYTLSFHQLQHF